MRESSRGDDELRVVVYKHQPGRMEVMVSYQSKGYACRRQFNLGFDDFLCDVSQQSWNSTFDLKVFVLCTAVFLLSSLVCGFLSFCVDHSDMQYSAFCAWIIHSMSAKDETCSQ